MDAKMNTKNLLVSFCIVAIVLFLVAFVSAATTDIATITSVEVDGIEDLGNEDIAVVAGETLAVKVFFTALEDASDVRMEAEVEGTKIDVDETTPYFDIEEGKRYAKTVKLVLPYELKDEVSDDLALNIKIWNGDFKTEHPEITLRIQRESYNVEVMSIEFSQKVEAGEILPVDVVVKNTGYNDLDDMYVTLRIDELGLEKKSYFGDFVSVEDDDDEDVLKGRFYLKIPYEALSGIYTVEAEATNDDLTANAVKQLIINNDFSSGNTIVNSFRKVVAAGENAEYELLLVNPTNKLKVYKIATEPNCGSDCDIYTSVDSSLISVPAGLSKAVTINAKAVKEGEYAFDVNVFSGDKLEDVVSFSLSAEGRKTNAIAVLTVILAIIFLVLLVALIVLIGKKPKKSEEFGESYY